MLVNYSVGKESIKDTSGHFLKTILWTQIYFFYQIFLRFILFSLDR
jgi:hypothetical protein